MDDLSKPEKRVCEAFSTGRILDFLADVTADPARRGEPGTPREIRAELLTAIACGAVGTKPGRAGRLLIRGASVLGRVDLHDLEVNTFIGLEECIIQDGIDLTEARTRTIVLRRCQISAIHMEGAQILGSLDAGGTHLHGASGTALAGYRATIARDLNCGDGFRADGRVDLAGVAIGGHVRFHGARLDGAGGPALVADGLNVAGSIYGDKGCQVQGEVRLRDASVSGQLNFQGALLDGGGGPALSADWLNVTGSMYCDRQFRALGEVRLPGASVTGQLNFQGALLDGAGGPALTADGLSVTGSMLCDNGMAAKGRLQLAGATLGLLADHKDSWPESIDINGLSYGGLAPYMPARERLDWLSRSGSYSAQPYEQLAAYYRRMGHDDQARHVLLAAQRARRRQRAWWTRGWGMAQDGIAGYGYAPGRAFGLLVVAFLLGWGYFRTHHPAASGPPPHASFNPALYTIDLLIPAPTIGQATDWDPHGTALLMAFGLRSVGWLLAITIVAALTRAFSGTSARG